MSVRLSEMDLMKLKLLNEYAIIVYEI